jgi:hypothetical protein
MGSNWTNQRLRLEAMVRSSGNILHPEVLLHFSKFDFYRWKIFVDYLSSTILDGFNRDVLEQQLLDFELSWQLQKWGMNDGEEWCPTGNLLDILSNVNAKWGDIF